LDAAPILRIVLFALDGRFGKDKEPSLFLFVPRRMVVVRAVIPRIGINTPEHASSGRYARRGAVRSSNYQGFPQLPRVPRDWL
jgi:hypothetical protein